jgi:hypothetical protein
VETRTWTTIDKTSWADGPWMREPDKEQWTDESTGLPCLLKRNHRSGALCGYVGVPQGHPWFGLSCDAVGVWAADRELTYSGLCEEGPEDRTICHVPAPGEPDRVWWLGFHCANTWDIAPGQDFLDAEYGGPFRMGDEVYRDVGYVKSTCAVLAVIAAAVAAMPATFTPGSCRNWIRPPPWTGTR